MSFRRLLKDGTTGLFFDGRGGWTPNHKDAYAFPDSSSAVRQAMQLGNHHVCLVLKFPDERLDVTHRLTGNPPTPGLQQGTNLLVGLFPVAVSVARALR